MASVAPGPGQDQGFKGHVRGCQIEPGRKLSPQLSRIAVLWLKTRKLSSLSGIVCARGLEEILGNKT